MIVRARAIRQMIRAGLASNYAEGDTLARKSLEHVQCNMVTYSSLVRLLDNHTDFLTEGG